MVTLVYFSPGVCLDPFGCVFLSVCAFVHVCLGTDFEGQLTAVPILPTGVRENILLCCLLIRLGWHWIRSECLHTHTHTRTHTHIHTHTLRRLLQVINYVCKGGNKKPCQWLLLLPSLRMCVQELGKINTRLWNWFVVSVVNVYMHCWCVRVRIFVFFLSSAVLHYSPQPVPIYHSCHCPQLS